MTGFLLHLLRATRLLARDERIPRPLRLLAAFGALPIPGPVDELVLLLVAPIFAIFYRDRFGVAWRRSAVVPLPAPDRGSTQGGQSS